MQILLGCGRCREKRIDPSGKGWIDLVTLDINPDCKPDKVWNMENIPLPFPNNSAEEIHAYEVLEHNWSQGDYYHFFKQFEDFWRILKPNGFFCAQVPSYKTVWALGDPGHTRIFNEGTTSFLEQKSYDECATSRRTDYRSEYKGNFKVELCRYDASDTFTFVLKALK